MKKVLGILASLAMAFAFTTTVKAADDMDFHMNVRFLQTDVTAPYAAASSPTTGSAAGRMSLHVVEFTAAKEVDNIGGVLTYRLGDQIGGGVNGNTQSYPVEAKAYYKFGKASKIAGGLQFVPFGIYKWNNLYNPFLDVPGKNGRIWNSDWGYLYTYDAKPILLDIGWWENAGELHAANDMAEKNTITARFGYDLLPNLNAGASYLDGSIDLDGDHLAQARQDMWALDATWGIVPNLVGEAEYVNYNQNDNETVAGTDGNLGFLQLKYDIVKVPAPLNKISIVGEYSFNNPDGAVANEKNYQEEIVFQAGKNLSVFWQNVQDKVEGAAVDKYYLLAFKYNLF